MREGLRVFFFTTSQGLPEVLRLAAYRVQEGSQFYRLRGGRPWVGSMVLFLYRYLHPCGRALMSLVLFYMQRYEIFRWFPSIYTSLCRYNMAMYRYISAVHRQNLAVFCSTWNIGAIVKFSVLLACYRIIHYLCTRILENLSDMESKVIPVRMTPEEVEELEKINKTYRYYKRSDVIRAAVQLMARYASPTMQQQIMAGYGSRWKGYKFTITNEQL